MPNLGNDNKGNPYFEPIVSLDTAMREEARLLPETHAKLLNAFNDGKITLRMKEHASSNGLLLTAALLFAKTVEGNPFSTLNAIDLELNRLTNAVMASSSSEQGISSFHSTSEALHDDLDRVLWDEVVQRHLERYNETVVSVLRRAFRLSGEKQEELFGQKTCQFLSELKGATERPHDQIVSKFVDALGLL